MELGIWERQHHRFGLAAESQAKIIESYLAGHPGRILYVGCGIGAHKYEHLSKYGSVVAIDREEKMLRNAREEASEVPDVEFKVADARFLQDFDPDYFDHILALGLFAYINPQEVGKVFTQFWRVCRTSGYLMLTNATRHPKELYLESANQCGFELVNQKEGYCPACWRASENAVFWSSAELASRPSS